MGTVAAPSCPAGVVGCEPEVRTATSTYFVLHNKHKVQNFIVANLKGLGYFHFQVENLPKDRAGCPGWWLFEVTCHHFVQAHHATIRGVRGDWTYGDNLDVVNRLTAGNRATLEEASKQTWTYEQARRNGFSTYRLIDAQGTPGYYTSVDVVFLP